jgi:hypothetical protein
MSAEKRIFDERLWVITQIKIQRSRLIKGQQYYYVPLVQNEIGLSEDDQLKVLRVLSEESGFTVDETEHIEYPYIANPQDLNPESEFPQPTYSYTYKVDISDAQVDQLYLKYVGLSSGKRDVRPNEIAKDRVVRINDREVLGFRVPANVKFENIAFEFIDSDHVTIKIDAGDVKYTGSFHCRELGFSVGDRPPVMPDENWEFLKALAVQNGIHKFRGPIESKIKARKSLLSTNLRRLFDIQPPDDDPFYETKSVRIREKRGVVTDTEYRIKIRLVPYHQLIQDYQTKLEEKAEAAGIEPQVYAATRHLSLHKPRVKPMPKSGVSIAQSISSAQAEEIDDDGVSLETKKMFAEFESLDAIREQCSDIPVDDYEEDAARYTEKDHDSGGDDR